MIATHPINGNAIKGMKVSQNGLDVDYGSNVFKSRLWTYLSRKPTWTYKDYQNGSKDTQSNEKSFNEVKMDITLWCIWDPQHNQMVPKSPTNLERIEGLIARSQPPQPTPPSLPTPPAPAPVPVAHQISLPEMPSKRNKLDGDLKALAREIFIRDPNITYEAIQRELKWEEFSTSNFYTMRARLRLEGVIPMPEGDDISHGRKLSGDVALARKNLSQLKLAELESLTCPKYKEKFGHHGIEAHNYYNAHRWAVKEARAKLPPPVAAPVAEVKAIAIVDQPKQMVAKNVVKIVASIDISKFKQDQYMHLQEAFKSYFDQRAEESGAKHSLQFMVTMDPATLEIRKRV